MPNTVLGAGGKCGKRTRLAFKDLVIDTSTLMIARGEIRVPTELSTFATEGWLILLAGELC